MEAFSESSLGKFFYGLRVCKSETNWALAWRRNTHIFIAELVLCKMDSAVRTSADFFQNCVLVYSMVRAAIRILIPKLCLRIESFLWNWSVQ